MKTQELNQQLYKESIERNELSIIKALKPVLSKDGNQWCWLLGEDLHDGLAGFGDTPYLAMIEFNNAFYTETIPVFKPVKEEE